MEKAMFKPFSCKKQNPSSKGKEEMDVQSDNPSISLARKLLVEKNAQGKAPIYSSFSSAVSKVGREMIQSIGFYSEEHILSDPNSTRQKAKLFSSALLCGISVSKLEQGETGNKQKFLLSILNENGFKTVVRYAQEQLKAVLSKKGGDLEINSAVLRDALQVESVAKASGALLLHIYKERLERDEVDKKEIEKFFKIAKYVMARSCIVDNSIRQQDTEKNSATHFATSQACQITGEDAWVENKELGYRASVVVFERESNLLSYATKHVPRSFFVVRRDYGVILALLCDISAICLTFMRIARAAFRLDFNSLVKDKEFMREYNRENTKKKDIPNSHIGELLCIYEEFMEDENSNCRMWGSKAVIVYKEKLKAMMDFCGVDGKKFLERLVYRDDIFLYKAKQ
jgi:hypothetical protein